VLLGEINTLVNFTIPPDGVQAAKPLALRAFFYIIIISLG
jgi:hypothetical protein